MLPEEEQEGRNYENVAKRMTQIKGKAIQEYYNYNSRNSIFKNTRKQQDLQTLKKKLQEAKRAIKNI